MSYVIGVDIGGTFTDCVVVGDSEGGAVGKSDTTKHDFAEGVLNSIEDASRRMGMTLEQVLGETELFVHGTTIGTNAVVERRGVKTGLITTRGHGDAIQIMRGSGRVAGVPVGALMDVRRSNKPVPLVRRAETAEVSERVDCFGEVVMPLNVEEAEQAVRKLLDQGCEAIAVSFLWAHLNDENERAMVEIVKSLAPDCFVTRSSGVVRRVGEYERTVATVLNAYIGPVAVAYIHDLGERLRDKGFDGPLYISQAAGGAIPGERATSLPINTLQSGPVNGVVASKWLAERLEIPNVITADMGGTTFDISLIVGGEAVISDESVQAQYRYTLPRVEITSIGAGGGSICWWDEISETLKVGPKSAGADPGPVAYGMGGTQATITDCDLVLGYINPSYFLGGRRDLDVDASRNVLAELGQRYDADPEHVASGAIRIADAEMANAIRHITVERGLDPRDFVMFAFGGAGPLHCCAVADEVGIRRVIVPMTNTASTWSALGGSVSGVVRIFEHSELMAAPFDADQIEQTLQRLEQEARAELAGYGLPEESLKLRRHAKLRYRLQVHSLRVDLPDDTITGEVMESALAEFERQYEALFGSGTGYSAAGFELSHLGVEATAPLASARGAIAKASAKGADGDRAKSATRRSYFFELGDWHETPVFGESALDGGEPITGPAILELPDTTVVIRPGWTAHVDGLNNISLERTEA